ncbi:hypothetical protein Bhyg_02997 [Pseudolycoriella hygida]|uniref:Uncharacterized protein n=1 Tax=Pseudolycoriella hygida TaxID=35572 RepID=A0A9Q0NCK1_9DIPT|nr:hypothetical protein Bhyg_02997 [Pseudolycoriella hygida]
MFSGLREQQIVIQCVTCDATRDISIWWRNCFYGFFPDFFNGFPAYPHFVECCWYGLTCSTDQQLGFAPMKPREESRVSRTVMVTNCGFESMQNDDCTSIPTVNNEVVISPGVLEIYCGFESVQEDCIKIPSTRKELTMRTEVVDTDDGLESVHEYDCTTTSRSKSSPTPENNHSGTAAATITMKSITSPIPFGVHCGFELQPTDINKNVACWNVSTMNDGMNSCDFFSTSDIGYQNVIGVNQVMNVEWPINEIDQNQLELIPNNDFGSEKMTILDSNLSYLDFNQIEYIPETEVADSSNNIFDDSNVEVPSNQISSSTLERAQTEVTSKSLYQNFGYDVDNTVDDGADTIESSEILPHSLLTNVNYSQRSCDDAEMRVPTSNESKQQKRLFCIFCKKSVSKLARHLTSVHKKEPEVKRLVNLPKGSKERLSRLAKLKNKGLFEHNTIRKYNKNTFIPCRRPNINSRRAANGFTSCAKCLGPYSKTSIRSHFKKCDAINIDLNGERSVLVLGRMVEGRVHEDACDILKDILAHMKEDDILRLVRFDWLITAYGNALCESVLEEFQFNVISGKLRLAGRLLSILKSITPEVTDFASLYKPKVFDNVIKAIRVIGKFDPIKKHYGSPSTSKAAVTLIRAVVSMLAGEYIRTEDVESQTRTENFNKLFDSRVTTSVSKGVYRTQAKMKREKREKLPSTEDIKLLLTYINKQLNNDDGISHQSSNRRRTGETQNITTTDYDRREYLEDQWLATLSNDDKKIAKRYSRMKIRGKLGRTVPCLVKPNVDKSIQLLSHHRKNANIANDNEFLFGLPNTPTNRNRRINACNVLRKLSVLCGAKEPETLRGTKMRKHVTSICILMELSESNVSEVAEFMGHHDKVHYQYYRKMPIVREVVKMSQLLRTAQGDDAEDDDDISDDEAQDDPNGDNEDWPDEVDSAAVVGAIEEENVDQPKRNDEIDSIESATHIEASEVKKKRTQTKWSSEEVAAAQKLFSNNFSKVPSLAAIDEERVEILKNRTSRQIKAWMYNQMKKKINLS